MAKEKVNGFIIFENSCELLSSSSNAMSANAIQHGDIVLSDQSCSNRLWEIHHYESV